MLVQVQTFSLGRAHVSYRLIFPWRNWRDKTSKEGTSKQLLLVLVSAHLGVTLWVCEIRAATARAGAASLCWGNPDRSGRAGGDPVSPAQPSIHLCCCRPRFGKRSGSRIQPCVPSLSDPRCPHLCTASVCWDWWKPNKAIKQWGKESRKGAQLWHGVLLHPTSAFSQRCSWRQREGFCSERRPSHSCRAFSPARAAGEGCSQPLKGGKASCCYVYESRALSCHMSPAQQCRETKSYCCVLEFARCPPNLNYWNVSWDKWCCHWTLISSEPGWMQEGGNIMADWLISKQASKSNPNCTIWWAICHPLVWNEKCGFTLHFLCIFQFRVSLYRSQLRGSSVGRASVREINSGLRSALSTHQEHW